MTEENIRYITNDDIPNIVEPCYITSDGVLWQWSLRQNKMKQKSVFLDMSNNCAKVNIMLYDIDGRGRTTKAKTVSVATLVYRYFNKVDLEIRNRLDIGHHDQDVMNCRLDNLYLKGVRCFDKPRGVGSYRKKKDKCSTKGVEPESGGENFNRIFGLQSYPQRLMLSDFDSVMTFFEMKKLYPTAVETKLTIDTTDWTAEQLRKLLKMRARLGDTVIK